jgi:UDP:flavonoid glycosyltransferase YjiC (YdhE family)
MASVIVGSVPIYGHVTPLLAVAQYLAARGDRVRFLTGVRFADAVTATGATHLPLPAGADFDDTRDWNATFPDRARLRGTAALAFDIEHVFIRPGQAQHDAVLAAHASEPADAVATDPAFAGGAFLVSHPRARRPPVIAAGVLPLSLFGPDVAPYGLGLPPAPVLNRLRNRVLTAVTDRVLAKSQSVADAIHRDIHGAAMPGRALDWIRRADAIAQFTVTEFEYPRSDAPPGLRFLGPITASNPTAELPSWWPDLDGTRPVVHVTQGTIANKDPGQLIGPTLTALENDDLLVVVTTGGRPLSSLPALPANARAAEFLPYDALLPRTSVFVTNGGYGGVHYALRHGVPIVVSGGQEDKPEVGARVAWSGVGYRFRQESPSPAALRKAVRALLADDRYRDRARQVAAAIARAPGLPGFAALIDDVTGRNQSTVD